MSPCSLVFLSQKEEVDMDEPLSNYPKREQAEFLVIDEDS